jgi:hypothetical protein
MVTAVLRLTGAQTARPERLLRLRGKSRIAARLGDLRHIEHPPAFGNSSVTVRCILGWLWFVDRCHARHCRQRGVAEGRSDAMVVAETAVEPEFNGRPLSLALTVSDRADMRSLVPTAVGEHNVLRLRLLDLAGNVVFSDDGSAFKDTPEDEALDAARGEFVARLTHLRLLTVSGPGDLSTPAHR